MIQGTGGSDCDFIPAIVSDSYITFESALCPGSHIGVLPSGQFSAPAQTNKLTDASQFKIKFIVSVIIIMLVILKAFVVGKVVILATIILYIVNIILPPH